MSQVEGDQYLKQEPVEIDLTKFFPPEKEHEVVSGLNVKSNEGLLYSLIGWGKCSSEIKTYEDCKRNGSIAIREPTECFKQARVLQDCYSKKAMNIEPLCMPIFNDARECLFKSDTHTLSCKQQINELVYCHNNPRDYVNFLKASTPQQKLPKSYDFVLYSSAQDFN